MIHCSKPLQNKAEELLVDMVHKMLSEGNLKFAQIIRNALVTKVTMATGPSILSTYPSIHCSVPHTCALTHYYAHTHTHNWTHCIHENMLFSWISSFPWRQSLCPMAWPSDQTSTLLLSGYVMMDARVLMLLFLCCACVHAPPRAAHASPLSWTSHLKRLLSRWLCWTISTSRKLMWETPFRFHLTSSLFILTMTCSVIL